MTWIGGIFSKIDMGSGELRNRLAVMTDAAFPTRKCPNAGCSQLLDMYVGGTQSHGIVQLSMPVEGVLSKHARAKEQSRLALVYTGHVYGVTGAEYEPRRARRSTNQAVRQCLADLLAGPGSSLERRVRKGLKSLDGDYALAVSDGNVIVASRDPRGTKPLYYAENDELCAFASSKRSLWKLGLEEVRPLRAGTLAVLGCQGLNIKKAFSRRGEAAEIQDMAEAVDAYERTLRSAVWKRLAEVCHTSRVGVLLSGGVDSCVMAKLVRDLGSQLGIETIAYTAGIAAAPDVTYAQEFARELDIKCKTQLLNIDRVEQYISEVIAAIEDGDFLQVETGVGLYAAVRMASRDGVRAVFSGQGPDELWGGYGWYPRVLAREGRRKLCWRMRDDFARLDVETLDRENKIAMAQGVELFFPYLDAGVVDLAMCVTSELKVTSQQDQLCKHPHRQLAVRLGIPGKYANREKLAIQHGTGVHGLLDAIARRNGFDHALVREVGYKSENISKEKLGSSARYGYRYLARNLWQVPQHVQFFLHVVARREGLLNASVRDKVGRFAEKAGLSFGAQA